MNKLFIGVLISLALVVFGIGGCTDEGPRERGVPQEDFVLSITWSNCERLVQRDASFSVSFGRTSSSVSTHMDGSLGSHDCDEPMKMPLERAERYVFDVEGRMKTWTYEEIEEQDFHITW